MPATQASSSCHRRQFLARFGAGLLLPAFVATRASGSIPRRPPSQRVVAALVGCGSRGLDLLAIHNDPGCTIAAVCDVDQRRVAAAVKRVGQCAAYGDFRRVLDRKDIDAILIATPDHWHAPITVLACQAGKDVYCEKPLCRTIGEGRAMVQAARRYGRVVQMGSQYRSIGRSRQACEWVRNGRLGRVHTVRLSHPPNPTRRWDPPQPVPPELDWDLWLGPAPWVPYHPARCHFTFRYFMDYGAGALADNGVHMFGVVSWAMRTDQTGPVAIDAQGTYAADNLYDVPVTMQVRYEFADPPFTLLWEQPGSGSLNVDFVGQQATLSGFWEFRITRGQADLSPTRSDELHLAQSDSHSANWLECIATRSRPILDVEIGHRITTWCHLGNIACRLGRKLRWDPAGERFIGDDEANRLLEVAYRPPWHL